MMELTPLYARSLMRLMSGGRLRAEVGAGRGVGGRVELPEREERVEKQ